MSKAGSRETPRRIQVLHAALPPQVTRPIPIGPLIQRSVVWTLPIAQNDQEAQKNMFTLSEIFQSSSSHRLSQQTPVWHTFSPCVRIRPDTQTAFRDLYWTLLDC